MKTTSIEPHKYKKDVYMVYIDGKAALRIHAEVVLDSGIKADQVLDQNRIDEIMSMEDYFSAMEYAQLLLSYRKRSSKEILAKLSSKGYPGNANERVLKCLKDTGDINDLEFAVWWINGRRKNRPKGNPALKYELRGKGLDDSVIENAIEIVNSEKPEDELELAWIACSSMLDNYRKLPVKTARRRLTCLLKRRGFSWEVIYNVTNEFFKVS